MLITILKRQQKEDKMTDKQIKDNLNYTMPFGKYKGRHISEIPDSYIDW